MANSKHKKPIIFAVGGTPGVGKSTITRLIAKAADIKSFTTDGLKFKKEFRKLTAPYRKSSALFPPKLRQLFYQQLFEWGKTELDHGRHVILDATFNNAKRRSIVYRLAKKTKAKLVLIEITKGRLKDETVMNRMRRHHQTNPQATPPAVYKTYRRYYAPFPPDWLRIHNDGSFAELKKKVTNLLKKHL